MRHRFERGRMSLALAIAVGLAAAVSLAGIVQAHDDSNDNGDNGGGFCPAGFTSIKVDPPVSGNYGGIQVTFSADLKTVSFTSSFDVDIVIVKGGPDANQYGPNSDGLPATSLSGLVAPLNPGGQQPQISFVGFCVDKDATATATVGAATHTPQVTTTVVPTGTVGAVTQTPHVTKTAEPSRTVGAVTQTPAVTKTPQVTPTTGAVTHTPVVTKTPDDDNGGVFPCPPGFTSIKVDPPVSGTYGGIMVTFSADLKSVSFVSPFPVDIVIVKGGPDANQYGPNSDGLPATSLSGLVAPLNPGGQQPQISFVRFCIDEQTVTPTATGTVGAATSTPVKTATHTSTAVSTNTPTATNTAVSTNTPVVTATNTVVANTATPVATGTVGAATSTPDDDDDTATPDDDDETSTPDADTSTPDTDVTPTGTAAVSTSTPQGIVGGATQAPGAGVGGAVTGPQAQARGGVALPDTGTGSDADSNGFALAFGALAIAGAGFTSLLLLRRRLS